MLPWWLRYVPELLNWLLKWHLLVLTRLWQALLRATLRATCPAPSPWERFSSAVLPFCLLSLCVLASPFSFQAEHNPCRAPPSWHPRHKRRGSPVPLFQGGKDMPNRAGGQSCPLPVSLSAQDSVSRLAQTYSYEEGKSRGAFAFPAEISN